VALCILVAAAWVSLEHVVRIRPKAPEAQINLAVIRTWEFMHFEEHGTYVAADPTPAQIPTSDRAPWPLHRDTPHGFNTLGWAPEGAVRCQYGVSVDGSAFTAEALCRHGDGVAAWGYVQPAPGQSRGIPGPFGRCSTLGTYNGSEPGSYMLETVGPCDEHSATLRY
jgi:hypothetical protein